MPNFFTRMNNRDILNIQKVIPKLFTYKNLIFMFN